MTPTTKRRTIQISKLFRQRIRHRSLWKRAVASMGVIRRKRVAFDLRRAVFGNFLWRRVFWISGCGRIGFGYAHMPFGADWRITVSLFDQIDDAESTGAGIRFRCRTRRLILAGGLIARLPKRRRFRADGNCDSYFRSAIRKWRIDFFCCRRRNARRVAKKSRSFLTELSYRTRSCVIPRGFEIPVSSCLTARPRGLSAKKLCGALLPFDLGSIGERFSESARFSNARSVVWRWGRRAPSWSLNSAKFAGVARLSSSSYVVAYVKLRAV